MSGAAEAVEILLERDVHRTAAAAAAAGANGAFLAPAAPGRGGARALPECANDPA